MKKHALGVCNVVAIRNILPTIVYVPGQDVNPDTCCDVRKQNVDRRDRAISAARSADVLPLEFPIAVKLKRILEALSEGEDIPCRDRDGCQGAVAPLGVPALVRKDRIVITVL